MTPQRAVPRPIRVRGALARPTGSPRGALTGLIWSGFARIFLQHHITWSFKSVCHFFGRRRFTVEDRSTDVFWLALRSLGESWHHNPRRLPAIGGTRSAPVRARTVGGADRPDARLGLAWDVVRIAPERQEQKLAASH